METVTVPKEMFQRIINHVEILLNDVELALDPKTQQRLEEIQTGRVKTKTEEEYYQYLQKREIKK